jgi:hypothetical protein
MASEDDEDDVGTAIDNLLRRAVGYRVDGPDGYLGKVHGVPQAGRPRKPLTLVVSDGATARFVSLRRVAAVVPSERLLVLRRTVDEAPSPQKWGRRPMAPAAPRGDPGKRQKEKAPWTDPSSAASTARPTRRQRSPSPPI